SHSCCNATPTTDTSPLSIHDALPICGQAPQWAQVRRRGSAAAHHDVPVRGRVRREWRRARAGARPRLLAAGDLGARARQDAPDRSEEHTSELQTRENLVCRLLLEKKK